MRLLSLDFDPVSAPDGDRSLFSSDTSVFDYDVVVWDPAASFHTYLSGYEALYQNLPSLSDNQSVQISSDARRRRSEFVEFINSGRVVVAVVRPPQRCYIDTGERQYSGTGRNRQATRIVKPFDLLSAVPVSRDVLFTAASGSRIELLGDGAITRLLRKYSGRLEYEAVMKGAPGNLLARVPGTDREVATIQRGKSGGYLILIPPVDLERAYAENESPDEDDDGWAEDASQFQTDLLNAIEHLAGGKVTARPAWAEHYATAKQAELQASVVKQQAKVERAREALAKLQQQQEAAVARDQLFLGTGRALELEVKDVLELLGGEVVEPEPGRDDWRVTFPEAKAVVEVKGVGKSAAEKHAAQLEKWVATAMEQTGETPKGILVVNTWREMRLEERTNEDFPNQMLAYCKSRKHCLVTGLQLFLIREDVEAKPERAEYWRKKLLQTSGPLAGAGDWQRVIKTTAESEG